MGVDETSNGSVLQYERRRLVLVIEIDLRLIGDVRTEPQVAASELWHVKMQFATQVVMIPRVKRNLVAGIRCLSVGVVAVPRADKGIAAVQRQS